MSRRLPVWTSRLVLWFACGAVGCSSSSAPGGGEAADSSLWKDVVVGDSAEDATDSGVLHDAGAAGDEVDGSVDGGEAVLADSIDTVGDTAEAFDAVEDVLLSPDAADSVADAEPDAAAGVDGSVDGEETIDAVCTPECAPGTKGCLDESTVWICGLAPGEDCATAVPYYCGKDATCSAGDCTCEPSGEVMCWYDEQWSSVYAATKCGSPVTNASDTALLPPVVDCGGAPGCYQGQCQPKVKAVELWPVPTSSELRAVLILGLDHVVVAGNNTTVYEYDHGAWQNLSAMDTLYTFEYLFNHQDGGIGAVTGRAQERRVAADQWETVHRFLDDGLTPPGTTVGSYLPTAAWAFDEETLFVATQDGGLHRSQSGEWSWVPTGYEGKSPWADFTSVWGSSPQDVWIVGEGGRARRFDGTSASPVPGLSVDAGGTGDDLGSVRGAPGAAVYVTRGHTVLRYEGGGFTPIYEAPEEGVLHRLFVAADDDLWAWGDSKLSHFDGAQWTVFDTELEGTAAKLRDFACIAHDHCWAVGTEGLVMRYDGSSFEFVSMGQGELPDGVLEPTAVFAASHDVVFTTIGAYGYKSAPIQQGWVRRHQMLGGTVAAVDEWQVPPAAKQAIGLRGLWGTAPDNMFVCSRVPMVFDGAQWLPLDLPPTLLDSHECVTLTGGYGELVLALGSKTNQAADQVFARRAASGGAWELLGGPDVGQIIDLWSAAGGVIYAMTFPYGSVSRLEADGNWTTLLYYPLTFIALEGVRFGVSNTAEILVNGGIDQNELVYQTSSGQAVHVDAFPGLELVGGFAVPPAGPGFLIAGHLSMVELVTGDLAPGTAPTFQQYKPYAYAKNHTMSIHAAAWGQIYIGAAPDGLLTIPAPWAALAP